MAVQVTFSENLDFTKINANQDNIELHAKDGEMACNRTFLRLASSAVHKQLLENPNIKIVDLKNHKKTTINRLFNLVCKKRTLFKGQPVKTLRLAKTLEIKLCVTNVSWKSLVKDDSLTDRLSTIPEIPSQATPLEECQNGLLEPESPILDEDKLKNDLSDGPLDESFPLLDQRQVSKIDIPNKNIDELDKSQLSEGPLEESSPMLDQGQVSKTDILEENSSSPMLDQKQLSKIELSLSKAPIVDQSVSVMHGNAYKNSSSTLMASSSASLTTCSSLSKRDPGLIQLKDGKTQCGICSEAFKYKKHAKAHYKHIHFPEEISCIAPGCNKTFACTKYMKSHFHRQHKN